MALKISSKMRSSFKFMTSSKLPSLKSFRIWGPTKIASYILGSESFGNRDFKYDKTGETVITLTNCFMRPSFMCKAGKITFWLN